MAPRIRRRSQGKNASLCVAVDAPRRDFSSRQVKRDSVAQPGGAAQSPWGQSRKRSGLRAYVEREVREALSYLESGNAMGKTVIASP
jgi:hypothetical protein